ncbi:SH3 domain-containing protein [Cohnella sp. OV330]|uniref:C40 family peptidase n=1 Tax=Cohnella sp. OV330 TaxID=1855288 RepID=UPI0008E6BF6E|nr:SH3 domain-containing C40 family peptidase [Cohnella sp. OV330]SFA74370.1 SH3 domain-containing protein [Cohnella sp. OV330]
MSKTKPILRRILSVGLCAAIGLGVVTAGQAVSAPKASAASYYDTKIKHGVNLRVSASASSGVIRMIGTGESVHVVGQANAYWLHVFDQKGNSGYISSSGQYTNYVGGGSGGSAPSAGGGSKANQVISIAQSYMGRVSYDYGTRNPSKLIFDCSAFTQFVFAKVGVGLKWGTKSQKSAGSFVSKGNLAKGDLVFFDTIGSNNGVINHVGIYMGGGKVIHDTPSVDGLQISSITSGFWSAHYVTARRVL